MNNHVHESLILKNLTFELIYLGVAIDTYIIYFININAWTTFYHNYLTKAWVWIIIHINNRLVLSLIHLSHWLISLFDMYLFISSIFLLLFIAIIYLMVIWWLFNTLTFLLIIFTLFPLKSLFLGRNWLRSLQN